MTIHFRTASGGPLCGQLSRDRRGWTKGPMTAAPMKATCRKCRRSLDGAVAKRCGDLFTGAMPAAPKRRKRVAAHP